MGKTLFDVVNRTKSLIFLLLLRLAKVHP